MEETRYVHLCCYTGQVSDRPWLFLVSFDGRGEGGREDLNI